MSHSCVSDGRGNVAQTNTAAGPPAAHRLALAAAPTFGLMTIWSTVGGGPIESFCGSGGNAWSLNGMAVMYALMAVFHSSPWLAMLSKWRASDRS